MGGVGGVCEPLLLMYMGGGGGGAFFLNPLKLTMSSRLPELLLLLSKFDKERVSEFSPLLSVLLRGGKTGGFASSMCPSLLMTESRLDAIEGDLEWLGVEVDKKLWRCPLEGLEVGWLA